MTNPPDPTKAGTLSSDNGKGKAITPLVARDTAPSSSRKIESTSDEEFLICPSDRETPSNPSKAGNEDSFLLSGQGASSIDASSKGKGKGKAVENEDKEEEVPETGTAVGATKKGARKIVDDIEAKLETGANERLNAKREDGATSSRGARENDETSVAYAIREYGLNIKPFDDEDEDWFPSPEVQFAIREFGLNLKYMSGRERPWLGTSKRRQAGTSAESSGAREPPSGRGMDGGVQSSNAAAATEDKPDSKITGATSSSLIRKFPSSIPKPKEDPFTATTVFFYGLLANPVILANVLSQSISILLLRPAALLSFKPLHVTGQLGYSTIVPSTSSEDVINGYAVDIYLDAICNKLDRWVTEVNRMKRVDVVKGRVESRWNYDVEDRRKSVVDAVFLNWAVDNPRGNVPGSSFEEWDRERARLVREAEAALSEKFETRGWDLRADMERMSSWLKDTEAWGL